MTTRLLVLAAVATLLPATPAAAATVAVSSMPSDLDLVFSAAANEPNDVVLRALDGNPDIAAYEVSDSGAPLSPGAGCTTVDAHTAHCQAPVAVPGTGPILDRFIVRLDDGDDRVIVDDAGGSSLRLLANGGQGDDELVGGSRQDVLDGGIGSDVMRGGAGTDTVSYDTRTDPVAVVLAQSAGHGELGEGDVMSAVENVIGGSGDDVLVGDDGPNLLDGRFGRDRLIGRAGDDTLTSGGGRTSCGGGRDSVVSLQLGSFGSELVDHVERDCEWIGPFDMLAAQPAVVRPDWIGMRISCPQPAPCSARARVFSATQRLLAKGRIRRGTWSKHLLRLRLTERGRRRLASSSGRAVHIEIRVGRSISRWTAHLDPPA
jgi:hypothetical protein